MFDVFASAADTRVGSGERRATSSSIDGSRCSTGNGFAAIGGSPSACSPAASFGSWMIVHPASDTMLIDGGVDRYFSSWFSMTPRYS